MKRAYEAVTHWVRFHASVTRRELELCTEGWIAPAVTLLTGPPAAPPPSVPDRLLALMEEAAAAVWLLQGEHDVLCGRVLELFGPREDLELPPDVSSIFASGADPSANLLVVRRSLEARAALLESDPQEVDAHTRLLFRRHVLTLRQLVLPSLDAIARDPAHVVVALPPGGTPASPVLAVDELLRRYGRLRPRRPRPHPDTFLGAALLRRGGESDDVVPGS